MPAPRARRFAAVLGGVLLVTLPACGSSDEVTSAESGGVAAADVTLPVAETTAPVAAPPSSVAATTPAAPAVDPASLPAMPGGAIECSELAQLLSTLTVSVTSPATPQVDTEQLARFRADLPAELVADLDLVVEFSTTLDESVLSNPGLGGRLNDPALTSATARLESYLESACV